MLIPLLRIPVRVDLSEILAIWLDAVRQGFLSSSQKDDDSGSDINNSNEKDPPEFSTSECQGDLKRLHLLRCQIGDSLTIRQKQQTSEDDNNRYKPTDLISLLQEYHVCLMEFENKGFPSVVGFITPLEWNNAFSNDDAETALTKFGHKGLSWERASILWNLAALEAFTATRQEKSKKGWNLAYKGFQSAYSYMHHLNKLLESNNNNINTSSNSDGDFQESMVKFWEQTLLAQAQMAGYESSASGRKPLHKVLSQLAAAAAPLWNEAEDSIVTLQRQQQQLTAQSSPHQQQLIKKWTQYAQAWSSFMKCKAEYHESSIQNTNEVEQFARLELSLRYGNSCLDVYEARETGELAEERLNQDLPPFLEKVRELYNDLLSTTAASNPREELRDIRGQILSKGPTVLSKAMLEWNSSSDGEDDRPPLFANLMGPEGRAAIAKFNRDMEQFVSQMSTMVDENTESARQELARVNLPHSLTAYKQEQSGG